MVSSLYIHIPFCASKCTYCDFYSIPTKRESNIFSEYIDALKTEIDFYINKYQIHALKTLYIGGGTPSFLNAELISDLLSFIKKRIYIEENAEITIEANPQDITKSLLETYLSAGINRLSVGVQCYSDEVLAKLKRRATKADIQNALQLIGENWLCFGKSFSVDMISGLPNLSNKEFLDGLKFVLSSKPTHVSLYSLMVEEGTALAAQVERGMVEYSEDINDSQWLCGRDFLIENGYNQYEVSNFSLSGFESEHNKVYWKLENYVGVGAGATGTVEHFRWNNKKNAKQYIDFWKNFTPRNIAEFADFVPPCTETEFLTLEDKKIEYLMLGFRLLQGVNVSEYFNKFGENLAERLGVNKDDSVFSKWEKQGLAKSSNTEKGLQLSLTKQGIQFLNRFLEDIL